MTYEFMRNFAGTWGLIYLFVIFVGVIIYVMRPSKRANETAKEAANIPLKNDHLPLKNDR